MVKKYLSLLLAAFILAGVIGVYGHGDEFGGDSLTAEGSVESGIYERLNENSIFGITIAALIAGVLTIIAIKVNGDTGEHHASEKLKWFLFLGIAIPVIIATIYSAGATIYLNTISETGGPVHWHADFEVWNCGERVDLISPTGLSNRVGTPIFHEHGDLRVHVEGVLVDKEDASLSKFFEVVGGDLHHGSLSMLTDNGVVESRDGDECYGKSGKVQVFVYKIRDVDSTDRWSYEQRKILDFENYVLAAQSQVPPGDCIIVEFDVDKELTDRICSSYEIAVERGVLHGS
jgi:hypothetical protein